MVKYINLKTSFNLLVCRNELPSDSFNYKQANCSFKSCHFHKVIYFIKFAVQFIFQIKLQSITL